MSTLKEKNIGLMSKLEETPHPGVRSVKMAGYLRDARTDQQITQYEYYLVEAERLSFEHQACVQPGWPNRVGISHLISLLNMKMMARRKSRKKPFNNGPYHDERFPWDLCAYEEMLLEGRFSRAGTRKFAMTLRNC